MCYRLAHKDTEGMSWTQSVQHRSKSSNTPSVLRLRRAQGRGTTVPDIRGVAETASARARCRSRLGSRSSADDRDASCRSRRQLVAFRMPRIRFKDPRNPGATAVSPTLHSRETRGTCEAHSCESFKPPHALPISELHETSYYPDSILSNEDHKQISHTESCGPLRSCSYNGKGRLRSSFASFMIRSKRHANDFS